ncbi:MAG: FG-GAP-like repeat-containing protein [Bacteroidota bacterium]
MRFALLIFLVTHFPILGYSQVVFGPVTPLSSCPDCIATAVATGDADGDGDLDLFYVGNNVGWHENLDGLGTFGPVQVISTAVTQGRGIAVGDIDGDGDIDVVTAAEDTTGTRWFENLDGRGRFSTLRRFTDLSTRPREVHLLDYQGDGDLDVAIAGPSDAESSLIYVNDGESFRTTPHRGVRIMPGDFNNDGAADLLTSSRSDAPLAVYLYDPNEDVLAQHHVDLRSFNSRHGTALALAVGDLDSDGAQDVISSNVGFGWYANTDGQGTLGERTLLRNTAQLLVAADMDNDGDVDLLVDSTASGQRPLTLVRLLENVDGAGTFASRPTGPGVEDPFALQNGLGDLDAADVNGDGRMDILGIRVTASVGAQGVPYIFWMPQQPDGTFAASRVVAPCTACSPSSTQLVDLDQDGDLDGLVSSTLFQSISWVENTGHAGDAGLFAAPQNLLSVVADEVHAADLDRDGNMDLLTWTDGQLAWHRNDGALSFGAARVIADSTRSSFDLADHDGDGDLDVLTTHVNSTDHAQWHPFEEDDFALPLRIPLGDLWGYQALSADLNGDGLRDLVYLRPNTADILWQPAASQWGVFGPATALDPDRSLGSPTYARLLDLDSDGDQDLIVSNGRGGSSSYYWRENTDGQGTFSASRLIVPSSAFGSFQYAPPPPPDFVDVDVDGDLDIVLSPADRRAPDVRWLEHTDGAGTFELQPLLDLPDETLVGLHVADLDGDTDLDILAYRAGFSEPIVWVENLTTSVSIEALTKVTSSISLDGIFPNPLSSHGQFTVRLNTAAPIRLTVFDMLGRQVVRLHDGFLSAHAHTFHVDTRGWPSGTYALRADGPQTTRSRLFTVAR